MGDKLPAESKLIERYGVSRVCLREALKKLSVLGVLRIVQGDGTYVNELIPSDVFEPFLPLLACKEIYAEEIYNARYIVEGGAVQMLAAIRTEEHLAKIKAEIDAMDRALFDGDSEAFSVHDRHFHEIILDHCGNPILASVGKMFQEIALEYTKMLNANRAVAQRSQHEHQMLYWAIQDKKGAQARSLMEMHMERFKIHLLEFIKARQSDHECQSADLTDMADSSEAS